MNTKPKILILIISLLVIGFITGFMFSRTFTQNKIRKFLDSGKPQNIREEILNAIQPDDELIQKIKRPVNEYIIKLRYLRGNFFIEMESALDSFKAGIEHHLSPQQQERLNNWCPRSMRHPKRKMDQKNQLPKARENF